MIDWLKKFYAGFHPAPDPEPDPEHDPSGKVTDGVVLVEQSAEGWRWKAGEMHVDGSMGCYYTDGAVYSTAADAHIAAGKLGYE